MDSVNEPSNPAIHDGGPIGGGPNHSSNEENDVDADEGESSGGDDVDTGDDSAEDGSRGDGSSLNNLACDTDVDPGPPDHEDDRTGHAA